MHVMIQTLNPYYSIYITIVTLLLQELQAHIILLYKEKINKFFPMYQVKLHFYKYIVTFQDFINCQKKIFEILLILYCQSLQKAACAKS